MTGAAFACLVRLHEAAHSQPGQTTSKAQQQPDLEAVQDLMGRMNLGRWGWLDTLQLLELLFVHRLQVLFLSQRSSKLTWRPSKT